MIPYSRKLLREKALLNFADLGPFTNISFARKPYPVVHENFLCEICMLVVFANIFSHENFLLYGIIDFRDYVTGIGNACAASLYARQRAVADLCYDF